MLAVDEPHKNSGLARHSSRLEKILEYHFLASLGAELYRRGIEFSVLRDDVDGDGRDLLIEADGVFRHIQLKSVVHGGARAEVTINRRLAHKRSACIIWYTYDPATFALGPFRWLGGAPGALMPELGDRIARSTRANAEGLKPLRADHRTVRRSRFELLPTVVELADRLFGPNQRSDLARVLDHLSQRAGSEESEAVAAVRRGAWHEIPPKLSFSGSAELAMMIDGYALLAELGGADPNDFLTSQWSRARVDGRWPGTATELWITLFLEHRRQLFAGADELRDVTPLLDELVQQLRATLISEGRQR